MGADPDVTAAIVDLDRLLVGAPPVQISRLSSSLSHELRNPLSSVKMAVQTLQRNATLSERDQRRLVIANREVRTMERMLWLFSEYGRDSAPNLEPVALRALIAEAQSMIELELNERKISLAVQSEVDPGGVRIRADGGRLRPVLAQLLLNVAMGLPEGAIMTVALASAAGTCSLALSDPTATFPVEERAKLFEPFGSMLARGAGLSLAALNRVMRAIGGAVSAESAASGGTVYRLTFPAG
jgi:signal transduction histidine kinase